MKLKAVILWLEIASKRRFTLISIINPPKNWIPENLSQQRMKRLLMSNSFETRGVNSEFDSRVSVRPSVQHLFFPSLRIPIIIPFLLNSHSFVFSFLSFSSKGFFCWAVSFPSFGFSVSNRFLMKSKRKRIAKVMTEGLGQLTRIMRRLAQNFFSLIIPDGFL